MIEEPQPDELLAAERALRNQLTVWRAIAGVLAGVLFLTGVWFASYRQHVEEADAGRDTCELLRDLDQSLRGYSDTEC